MEWIYSITKPITGLFKGLLNLLGLYKKEGSILFLGLDNSGKSTLL